MERTPSPRKVMSRSPGQQGGRTRTTGTGKLPKQFKRVTVSFQHKLSVIEFYDAVVTKEKMRDTVNYFYPSLTAAQVKAKKRQEAWNSLPSSVIVSGFQKAKLVPKDVTTTLASSEEQRLLHIEPDWELLSRLLDEVPVIRHVVDPNRDIDTLAAVE